LIEAEYYQFKFTFQSLNKQIFTETASQKTTFWNDATQYTLSSHDESFVEEVAYMMVTLHRTGA
jgi:hypothetical protein